MLQAINAEKLGLLYSWQCQVDTFWQRKNYR